MIGSLPQRIPGETFESMVARLSGRITAHGGPLKGRDFLGEAAAERFSPDKLLTSLAVPEWLTLTGLLEEHTVLPVFRPFLDQVDCDRLVRQLKVSEKSATISRTLAPTLRFCPDCRTTELEGIAEVGWQVLHQFRWFWRCQTHRCALWQLPPRGTKQAATPLDTGCRTRADIQTLNAIERDTKWLAGARVPPLGRLRWKEFHRAAITARFGIQPPYISCDLFPLAHGIPPKVRAWLQLPMISHLDNWLLSTVRGQVGTSNPLLHLATLRLCGKKIRDAVRQLTAAEPAPAHVTPTQLPQLNYENSKAPNSLAGEIP